MASRIWITCDHEHLGPHLTRELPTAISNEGWCQGGRVLTEGEYVLIEKVDGEWPAVPCLSCDGSGVFGEDRPGHVIEYLGCPDCQGQGIFPYALTSEMFDALAGGES